ncbi:DUF4328 domain-containing protein [Micropruina sp.]|uniref:DUF4328 domain-containing protein n=1 Tax=Micropruina sp. TaxID=2737536 RepID=UPI0039E65C37
MTAPVPSWQPAPAAPPAKPLSSSFSFVAIAAQLSLLLVIGTAGATLVVSVEGLALVDALDAGTRTVAEAENFDARVRVLAILANVFYLLTAGLFMSWMYMLRTSAAAAPEAMRHGAGWTIGGWMVPILNLFRPYQIMVDLWRGMARPARPFQAAEQPSVPRLVPIRWASFLVASIGGRVAITSAFYSPATLDSARQTLQAEILVDAASVIAGLLAISVLRMYTTHAKATPPPVQWLPMANVWPSAAPTPPDTQFPYGRPSA